jgi:hypothetical protein
MAMPHDEIQLKISPDDYHIKVVGKTNDGLQVFVTSCLNYDHKSRSTTDYDVALKWDNDGNFINDEIIKIGKRGDYKTDEVQNGIDKLTAKLEGLEIGDISVRPCSVLYEGIVFGLIPRTDDDETFVELMPGNSICFLEPFDGEYDT